MGSANDNYNNNRKSSSDRVQAAHRYLREILSKSTPRARNQLLKKAPLRVIKHICNLCNAQCRHSNKTYDPAQLKRIEPHLKDIRVILSKTQSLKNKRRILQKGGFFPVLASILAPAIGGLITALVNRSSNNNG